MNIRINWWILNNTTVYGGWNAPHMSTPSVVLVGDPRRIDGRGTRAETRHRHPAQREREALRQGDNIALTVKKRPKGTRQASSERTRSFFWAIGLRRPQAERSLFSLPALWFAERLSWKPWCISLLSFSTQRLPITRGKAKLLNLLDRPSSVVHLCYFRRKIAKKFSKATNSRTSESTPNYNKHHDDQSNVRSNIHTVIRQLLQEIETRWWCRSDWWKR